MPSYPPGSPNPATPAVTATLVFTPTPGATATVSVYNYGSHNAYIGKSGVNQADGMPVPPGNAPVRLQNFNQNLYAVCDVSVGTLAGSISTAYTAGSTAVVFAASVATSAGATLIIGNTANTGWEAITVGTVSASGTTISTTPLVSDHIASQPVYLATALGANLLVQAGVV
jgi:hypothetical protein